MPNQESRIRRFFNDWNISLIVRWWAAGAVYFFIGWGTSLGNQQYLIDFVFVLGLVMGLFNILIINPGLRMMFNIGGPRRPRKENTGWQRLSDYLVELLKNLFIMLVIAMIYVAVNRLAIALFSLPENTVVLPGEPILFGLFYVLIWLALYKLSNWLKGRIGAMRQERA